MAKIRTVKPQLARHRTLFEMEQQSGLPMRFIWAMFPTVCDRKGRFVWRPWELKLDICPYDNFDFEKAMDVLHQNGMLRKYRVGAEIYGDIPTFEKHQHVNTRESKSLLPDWSDGQILEAPQPTCMHVQSTVAHDEEGKGREGKRKGSGREVVSSSPVTTRELIALYCDLWKERYNAETAPVITGAAAGRFKELAKHGPDRARRLIEAYLQMPDSWFVTKRHDIFTLMGNINAVSLFADSGKMISKAELKDLENKVSQHNMIAALERGEI